MREPGIEEYSAKLFSPSVPRSAATLAGSVLVVWIR